MSGSISQYVANSPFAAFIANTEQQLSIPSGLLGAQLYQESTLLNTGGNGGGIGQFIPSTAAQYGVDTSDPYSGITGAGNYLSDLYQQTGSWVQALQSYGTLPSNLSGNLTAGQQNVLSIAQAADQGGDLSATLGGVSGVPGLQSLAQAPSTASGAANSAVASVQQWVTGALASGAIRIAVIVLAIFIIILGVADLAFNKSPAQVVSAVKRIPVE